jgi:hypothetical protein
VFSHSLGQKATSVGPRLSDICEYLRQLFGPVGRDHMIGSYLVVMPSWRPVCTENLSSDVFVVKSAKDGV